MNIKLKNYLKINKEMLTFSKKNTRITNQWGGASEFFQVEVEFINN